MPQDEREEKRLPSSFEPPDCERLNELLPAFRFCELIACGGMGAVYRARQVSLERDVAIKVLPPDRFAKIFFGGGLSFDWGGILFGC